MRSAQIHRNGNGLNPRQVRGLLQHGVLRVEKGPPPPPPPEWPQWKRERFVVCIRAAHLFLVKGKSLPQTGDLIGKSGLTDQRIAQMVARGMRFFLDRRYIRKAE